MSGRPAEAAHGTGIRGRLQEIRRAYLERDPDHLLAIATPDWVCESPAELSAAAYARRVRREWSQVRSVEVVELKIRSVDPAGERARSDVDWSIVWIDAQGERREAHWRQWHEWVRTDTGWKLTRTTNYRWEAARQPWN